MIKKHLSYFLIFVMAISVISCSTIMNGDKDQMKVDSKPADAIILVDGIEIGRTPAMLNLKRGETHIIEIKKEGYETYRLQTSKSITGWFWGNLVCGGIIGFVIDLATGNAYDIDPGIVTATLSKDTGMLENYRMPDFQGIQLFDEYGNELANVKVIWE